jgi:hypothetical protein
MNRITTHGTTNGRLGAGLLYGLALVGLGAALTGCRPATPSGSVGEVRADAKPSWFKSKTGEDLEPLQLKIEEWEAKEATTKDVLAKLEREKQSTVNKLREVGVSSSKDLKDNPKGQRYALDLQDIAQKIAAVQKKDQEQQDAIDRGKAELGKLERDLLVKKAGVSDEDVANLKAMIMSLDEKLAAGDQAGPAVDLKLEATVDKELQTPKKP